MILVSSYKGETSTKRPWAHEIGAQPPLPPNLPANPPMLWPLQSADCGWGWLIWLQKLMNSVLTLVCCTLCTSELSGFTIRNYFVHEGYMFFLMVPRNFCCPIVISNLVPSKKMVALCHRCNDATVLMGKRWSGYMSSWIPCLKLTSQCKMDPLKMYFLLNMGRFHCYVSFRFLPLMNRDIIFDGFPYQKWQLVKKIIPYFGLDVTLSLRWLVDQKDLVLMKVFFIWWVKVRVTP